MTLIVGLATDLDQRLLPDELTLPVIPVALVYALSGQNPLVGAGLVLAVAAAILIPAVLYLPSIPFGAGAFGLGDVKLLVGVGLLVGGERALGGVAVRAARWPGVVLGAPARDAADRAADVRAVRAVPHPRRAVGRAHPALKCRLRVRRSHRPPGTIGSDPARGDRGLDSRRPRWTAGVSCPGAGPESS